MGKQFVYFNPQSCKGVLPRTSLAGRTALRLPPLRGLDDKMVEKVNHAMEYDKQTWIARWHSNWLRDKILNSTPHQPPKNE